eukprot:GFKZ01013430.1.p1 GENE.GFKZ01013430.1~~GFKZ01013430.1.p1  ORF type:complete len:174 (+),score=31.25 GFKZ01013430.1:78-599(+)
MAFNLPPRPSTASFLISSAAPAICTLPPPTSPSISRRQVLSLPFLLCFLPSNAQALPPASEARDEALSARASTTKLETLLELDEFTSFRQALRSGPMSRIRASCSALVRRIPDANTQREAQQQYQRLIRAVEAVDFAALEKERGSKKGETPTMSSVETEFDAFLNIVDLKSGE